MQPPRARLAEELAIPGAAGRGAPARAPALAQESQAAARGAVRARWAEAALLAALFALALLARLSHLLAAPEFTDEVGEMDRALLAYSGGQVLLVGTEPYIGPLWSYLLALGWHLVGRDPALPRVLVALFGAATVPLVYLLGRVLHSRAAGLATALLLAASGFHVLVNSHVGWSGCTTAFFSTAGTLALALAIRHRSGPALALAGLCFGLAVQTHIIATLLLPGPAVTLLWKARRLAFSRWGTAAAALFLLATSTYLIYNVETGLKTWRGALRNRAGTNEAGDLSPATYLRNLQNEMLPFGLVVEGAVPGDAPSPAEQVGAMFFTLLAIAALLQQARRGEPLPLVVAGSGLLLMPLVNNRYSMPANTRYLTPMVIVVFVAIAALLADLAARRLARRPPLALAGTVAAAALLALPSVLALARTYAEVDVRGSQAEVMRAAAALLRAQPSGEPLVVDLRLSAEVAGGGDPYEAMTALLDVFGLPYKRVKADPVWLDKATAPDTRYRGFGLLSCPNYLQALRRPGVVGVPLAGRPASACVGVGLAHFGVAA